MSYYFFFSYKRVVDGPYLQNFFDELSKEVRGQLQLTNNDPVGFFDQKGIELGEQWEPTLAQALQESAVLVCAYSPRYFESEYCGKEWQVFQMRREEYQRFQLQNGAPNAELPPVIKPVLWQKFTAKVPPVVTDMQYTYGNPQEIQNEKGLRWVVKRSQFHQQLYTDYIEWLAGEIIAAAQLQLPELPNLPPLKQIPSAFTNEPQPLVLPAQQQQPVAATASGNTKHVRFIFVAGNPKQFGGQRQGEAYGERGSHWKPFHPKIDDRIGRLLQHFVSSQEIDFDSDIVDFGDDLVNVLQQAYDERKIVVLLVDSWTISWDNDWRSILSEFEKNREPFYNCSVLVPWNESDLEIQNERDQIMQAVRDTFKQRANFWKNPVFYRDSITSLDDLYKAVSAALESIRSELHKRVEDGKPVPKGISKPVVSNQPAQTERQL